MTFRKIIPAAAALALLAAPATLGHETEDQPAYEKAGKGTRWLEAESGARIKMLVEEANLGGGELEIAEIVFPAGRGPGGGHLHQSIEIFYILSGTFEHTVNGEAHTLTPGMIGIVRPGDTVSHAVLSEQPVRALIFWVPGGEAARLEQRGFTSRPIE